MSTRAYYNEIDPFAAAWLRELIAQDQIAPGEVDERDIQDIAPADLHGFAQCHFFAGIGVWSYALRRAGWPDDRPVWTGSCPCQPFSAAGKGGGFDDERHLWPAWYWLIDQCQPAVVFGEQVASKAVEPWVDLVHADLEALGYAFGAVPFPSAGVGAPHIRDRLYWLADADSRLGREGRENVRGRLDGGNAQSRAGLGGGFDLGRLADANDARPQGRLGVPERADQRPVGADGVAGWLALPNRPGWQSGQRDGAPTGYGHPAASARGDDRHESAGPTNGIWRDADWLFCRDGRWRPVEPGTFPLVASVAKGMGRGSDPSAPINPVSAEARVMRLRGYGNAINAEAATTWIESYIEASLIDQRAAEAEAA